MVKIMLSFTLAFLWGGVLYEGIWHAREHANRIACSSNLKAIYLTLEQYAEDNGDFFPPDLRTLQKQGYLADQRVFRCPRRTRPNSEFSDYLYLGKGRRLSEPPFLLLRDRKENHLDGYRNAIFSNGNLMPFYEK